MERKPSILIVDDNPTNIQVASSLLEKNGYDTEYALESEAAFAWLNKTSFDLILLDVMIPGLDGFEICRMIKQNPNWNKIPIIFVTARVDRESVVKGFDSGGEDYLTKPFNSMELLARVRLHIELKRSREELIDLNHRLKDTVSIQAQEIDASTQDLIEINRQLTQSNEELKRIEIAKQNFFKVLGNEVGNSLHDITGMLQVIKYRVDSKKVAQLVDRIDHTMLKLETFVNTALRITELQLAGKSIKYERLEINKLIGFSMFQLDEKIRRKQIQIINDMADQYFFVAGESQLIKACLIIVFDFFLERNEINSVIKIDLIKQLNGIVIEISDQGNALTESEQELIFDFYNVGNQSLSLAKIIAEAHSGEMSIANHHDKGIVLTMGLHTMSNIQDHATETNI
jgi:DNA-binding response OmpR family regulator